MEDSGTYVDRLDQALAAKIGRMNASELKQLKDEYKLFQSAFQGIYGVLLKKGLIHEDPYKYDLKISEVGNPPETPFAESEKVDQMCVRLSQYESYLDFLNNYYEFSVEFLTMGRIKRLANLTKYFNFTQYSENSQFSNTRCLAELTSLVKKGSDPLSSGIINEGLLQLEKTSRKVFKTLKELSLIHKERYKVDIRRLVLTTLSLDHDFVITHEDDVVRRIKQKFVEVAPDRPFYPELVVEVLKEDYSSDGESIRDAILKQLEVTEEKQHDQMADKNFKAVLIDGTRAIIAVGFQLEDAIRKLQENQTLLDAMDKSFITKAKRVIRQMFGGKVEHIIHDVEYLDPVSSERKHESIDVTAFWADATKRAQSLSAMVSKSSASFKRMEGSSEEIVYKFLARSIEEFQGFHRKLAALDDFYLGAITDAESKGKIRSIKIELGSIKNAIIKANQKRHEYIAQKEEMEQMKRLGIRDV